MAEIEIKGPSKVRKGESGSLSVSVPGTIDVKKLLIEVPKGISIPDGNEIIMAPEMQHIDIPFVIAQEAPDQFKVKIDLIEEKKAGRRKGIQGSAIKTLKVEE